MDLRLYSPRELRALLDSAGWTMRSLATNFQGDPIDARNPQGGAIVAVAARSTRDGPAEPARIST